MNKEKEIISLKGTRLGILMSIVEDEPFSKVLECLEHRFKSNRQFFGNSPISLDLGWREIDEEELDGLLSLFQREKIHLMGIISSSLNTRRVCESRGLKVIIGRLGLADHKGREKLMKRREVQRSSSPSFQSTVEVEQHKALKGTDDTLLIRKTVRSGQKIEFSGNLVIMGDVNPAAEVRSGGDLIILGALRGIAHAGYNNKEGNPVIIAFKFRPTQIKIKDVMVNKFDKKIVKSKQPVIATLKEGVISFKIYS